MSRLTIDQYGIALAATAASRSEDQHRQVGAALMRPDRTIAALGYNGAPPGVELDWADRDARRLWVIHAEANALRYVTPGEVATLYTTAIPCERCILLVAAYDIHRVVYRDRLDPLVYDHDLIERIAHASGVALEQIA